MIIIHHVISYKWVPILPKNESGGVGGWGAAVNRSMLEVVKTFCCGVFSRELEK